MGEISVARCFLKPGKGSLWKAGWPGQAAAWQHTHRAMQGSEQAYHTKCMKQLTGHGSCHWQHAHTDWSLNKQSVSH